MSLKNRILPHLAPLAIIICVNIIYFLPQFQGKVLQQSDIVSSDQATATLKEYREANNKTYLWNPSQFGGMPVLAGAPSKNNLIYKSYKFIRLGISEPTGVFIAGSILCYLLFILLGVNHYLSVIFSIAIIFTASNVILWEAGHNSKIRTLIFTPILIAGVLSIFERQKYLLGFILLSFGFSMSFFTRHPQMTFYILIVFMVYGIIFLYKTYQSKKWKHFLTGAVVVFASIIIGGSTSTTKIWSLYDYSKVTMRGEPILSSSSTGAGQSSSTVEGLDWNYAMQWSNDYKDVLATFIPGFVGGGSGEPVSTSSESFKRYNLKNAPLYWGQLPSTVGPLYLGATVLFLFIFGSFIIKGNVKWWLGFGLITMVVLSMGKNLEFINRLIFDIFPFYSKFRAPQSIINITPFFTAILAALAVQKVIGTKFKSKKSKKNLREIYLKPLYYSFGIAGGLSAFIWLVGPSLFNFTAPGDTRFIQQGVDISAFISDRKGMMSGDALRSLLLICGIVCALWAFITNRIGKSICIAIMGFLVVFDVVGISWRYLNHSKFVAKKVYKQNLTERPVDLQIKQLETDKARYRVHDLTINSFNSSQASAFHNTIGGYDPAKIQRYEDLRNFHINKGNIQVLNMLNCKYFIVNGENNTPTVQGNPGALGIAWFVNQVVTVSSPNEEINTLDRVNTANTAVVLTSEFPHFNANLSAFDSTATITMSQYEPDKITYNTQSSTEMIAVFSEIWYGPNKGWQAYIDGTAVDHVRANYALRAMNIPSGQHEIVFEFKPKPFYVGENISLLGSLIMILCFAGYGYGEYKKFN